MAPTPKDICIAKSDRQQSGEVQFDSRTVRVFSVRNHIESSSGGIEVPSGSLDA
jgi:hypothetical protein